MHEGYELEVADKGGAKQKRNHSITFQDVAMII